MRFQVDDEFSLLEAVLVHRPGPEIDRLTHDNMARFLFEDVPYLKRMQDEHDCFTETMRQHGVHVFLLEDMLLDVIQDSNQRASLLEQVCRSAGMPAIADDLTALKHWDASAIVDILFAGVTADEYRDATGRRIASAGAEPHFLLPPVPNAYFSRDPAVVVHDAAISCKMHYRERVRETLLVRAVLEHHPEFSENPITYGGTDEPTEDRPYTIEGGDVIVLSPESVLIGSSERTRSETIELLAGKCFQFGQMKRVYEIPIPTERAFMHLDTIFTILDAGTVLWFSPVMDQIQYIHRYEPAGDGDTAVLRVSEERSFLDVLRDEFDMEVTVVPTGGGHKPFDAREQRADGTNAFALAPRVAITYERNERTNAALTAQGITCISIDDSELVRGLGGPRCMSMPLRRRAVISSPT